MTETKVNPLGSAPIGKLMVKFAIPSIVAMLVGALYNIVDQLFIGHAIGTLGNAATNVALLWHFYLVSEVHLVLT